MKCDVNFKMMLKVYLHVYMIASVIAPWARERLCDFFANGRRPNCYRKEVLVTMTHSPNQIAVDKSNNDLYFSFDSGQGEYIPARIHIGNSTVMVLKGVKDAFAMVYDNDNSEMYFGGSYGIYKYHPDTKKLKRLALPNLDIWWLVVKRGIYFVKFPSLVTYRYENKTLTSIPQLKEQNVHQFVFDGEDNIFFLNNTGLYGIKRQQNQAVLITEYPRFLGMARDSKGDVFLCNEDGIFILNRMLKKVIRLVNVQGVLGLAFDENDNIIYSDSHELVKLTPDAEYQK